MDKSSGEEDFYELVYDELHKLASAKMAREYAYSTLQSTALVNEAWLKLGGDEQPHWLNRAHFFAAAAEAMRRILIDRARKRKRIRHGGGLKRVEIDSLDAMQALNKPDDQLLLINDALERLERNDPRKAELVKLRFFFGLSIEESAQSLQISPATAQRWWIFAKAWLFREISKNG